MSNEYRINFDNVLLISSDQTEAIMQDENSLIVRDVVIIPMIINPQNIILRLLIQGLFWWLKREDWDKFEIAEKRNEEL